jgi:hypothetical protein
MTSIPRTPKERATGATHLKDVAAVTITLESGEQVTLHPDNELKIPTDPILIKKEALRAPAQLAFWAYQTERALKEVRNTEYELAKKEGDMSLVYRQWYLKEKATYTEDMIRSRLSVDAEVDALRKQLLVARDLYGVIRATRDSVEHRVYVLRKIIGQDGATA